MSRSASRPRVCAVPVPVPHLPTKFCSSAIDEIFGAKHRNFWKKIWKMPKKMSFLRGFLDIFGWKKELPSWIWAFFLTPFSTSSTFKKKHSWSIKKWRKTTWVITRQPNHIPIPGRMGAGHQPPISFFWGRKQRHDFSVWLFTPRLYWLISCPKKLLNWDARPNLGENGDKSQFSRKKINKSGEECAGGCVGIA